MMDYAGAATQGFVIVLVIVGAVCALGAALLWADKLAEKKQPNPHRPPPLPPEITESAFFKLVEGASWPDEPENEEARELKRFLREVFRA